MNPIVDHNLTRRQILATGAAGLGFVLTGCASRRRRPLSRDPIWPEGDPAGSPSSPDRVVTSPHQPLPSGMPQVIDRSRWASAGPVTSLANPMGSITRITIHHDGMPPVSLRTERDAAERIERIRAAHRGQGWADIGYHYVIDPQGRVWRARPRSLQGAHVKYNNENNLGIMVLGNFMIQEPTPAALSSLDVFVVGNMRRFNVTPDRVYTHQELRATACPGTSLQSYMVRTRSRGGVMYRA